MAWGSAEPGDQKCQWPWPAPAMPPCGKGRHRNDGQQHPAPQQGLPPRIFARTAAGAILLPPRCLPARHCLPPLKGKCLVHYPCISLYYAAASSRERLTASHLYGHAPAPMRHKLVRVDPPWRILRGNGVMPRLPPQLYPGSELATGHCPILGREGGGGAMIR